MATDRHPSPFLPRWLFWLESLLLVTITALLTFFVLKDDVVDRFGSFQKVKSQLLANSKWTGLR